jgi:hypothetical protein
MPRVKLADRRERLLDVLRERKSRWITTRRLLRDYGFDMGYGFMSGGIEVVRSDLADLERRGLVKRAKVGRGYVWSATTADDGAWLRDA